MFRKHTLLTALLFCFTGLATVSAFEQPLIYQLKSKDTVLVIGDSTTADGLKPAGYVRLVEQALSEQIPDQGVGISGLGYPMKTTAILGGQIANVKKLLEKGNGPTVVIINLGLNDSKEKEKGVTPFTDNLRKAIGELQAMKVTAIICTPTTWGGLTQTKPYAEAARALATETKCLLIDLYAVHADHIVANTKDGKLLPGTNPTRDGVHMNGIGETLSAGAVLQAFGLKTVWKKYQLRTMCRAYGKITIDPDLPFYEPGTKVTVTAIPADGAFFKFWSGDHQGSEAKTTVTMDRHRIITTDFRPLSEQK